MKTAAGVKYKAQKPEHPVVATEALPKGADVEQYVSAARERLQRDGYEEKLLATQCLAPISLK